MNKENTYHEIMGHIAVTPDMERRIMANLEREAVFLRHESTADHTHTKHIGKIVAGLAACALLVISLSTFLPDRGDPGSIAPPPLVGVPGVTTYETKEALSAALSYPLMTPATLPEHYLQSAIRCYSGELAELVYLHGTDELVYRMSPGTEDNSGDWTDYQTLVSAQTEAGGHVTLKGSVDGFLLAVWTDGTHAFSVSTTVPMSQEALMEIINGVSPLP